MNPIFITGAARSGTTLLQYMLRSHPQVSLPSAESHFFIPFHEKQKEYGDLSITTNLRALISDIYAFRKPFFDEDFHGFDFNVDDVVRHLEFENKTTLPEIIDGIFMMNAKGEGKVRWGDKTPGYVLYLDTIMKMFPGAQIVHLIRDGRDCALSMLQRSNDLNIFNIYHAAYTWNRYVQRGVDFGKRHPDCYYPIRYEDLLESPKEKIQDLCQFLRIEYSQSMIDFNKPSSKGGKTPLLREPLKKSNRNKWESEMSKNQKSVFESVAGQTLEDCGYKLTEKKDKSKISSAEIFLYELHIKVSHALKKMKKDGMPYFRTEVE